MERVRVAIVGGGQAGLATSCHLSQAGIEHIVLEAERVGRSWRDRWDSFCLVTPNWTVMLPDHPYRGDDPDGYLLRDDIVRYLESYAAAIDAPVREGVEVRSLRKPDRFVLDTTTGTLEADAVVLATGTYRRPHRPPGAEGLPADLDQVDVADYRNPGQLPSGDVLIVGSGQSGCQLAEELTEAGRHVVLACGRAPWGPRRIADRDVVWWAWESGFLDQPVDSLPSPEARLWANILATGRDGGHDLHLRTLRELGVTLVGHFLGAEGRTAWFAPDLAASVAWGDEAYARVMSLFRKTALERGIAFPDTPAPPFDPISPDAIDLSGFGAVIFAGGYRPDFGACVPGPEALDDAGFPRQRDGASTAVDDLYFVGVHFQRTRRSSLLCGVGEDAAIVAATIAARS